MSKRSTGFAALAILIVVLFLILGGGALVWQKFLAPKTKPTPGPVLTLTPAQNPTITVTSIPTATSVTGSVIVYHVGVDEATIQLTAESPNSNVTEMLIWTDKKPRDQAGWKPFQTLAKIPISEVDDKIFAIFRDEQGNISDVYSDTLTPPFGPPNAPDSVSDEPTDIGTYPGVNIAP